MRSEEARRGCGYTGAMGMERDEEVVISGMWGEFGEMCNVGREA
jgi:hypothetical protein